MWAAEVARWVFGYVVGGVLWVEVQREACGPDGEVLGIDERQLTLPELLTDEGNGTAAAPQGVLRA